MEKITVAQVTEEQEKVDKLEEEKSQVRETMSKEISRVDQVYRDKVWEIEHEKRVAIERLESARDAFTAGMDKGIAEHYQVIEQCQRILEIFRMPAGKVLAIDDKVEVHQYAFQYQECLGYLLDDYLLKIKAFIVGNRKPKNKYTLAVIGRSIFSEPLIKFPQGYGLDITTHARNSFEQNLRDAATAEELKEYYARHKGDLLTSVIEEYREVKQEYLNTLANYKIAEFEALVTWRCPDCNNFRTIYESDGYREDPQCYYHDPYVKMTKTLNYATTQKLKNI